MQDQYPEIFIQAIVSLFIALLLIGFIVTIFKLYQHKKQVQGIEMENLRTSFEKELLQTRLEIQEEVLKNISMEIHDNIGQIMLLTNVNLSIIQSMPLPEGAPELIKDTKLMLSKATEDISQLSRSLNSDRITQIGVFTAIRHELHLLEKKGLFEVVISDPEEDSGKNLIKETQLLIFRMFQEICNNIIKHAKATKIELAISHDEKGIDLEIADNGIGFSVSPAGGNNQVTYNGVGMRSLQSRASLFKGTIQISSVLQKGTTISIFIPAKVV